MEENREKNGTYGKFANCCNAPIGGTKFES